MTTTRPGILPYAADPTKQPVGTSMPDSRPDSSLGQLGRVGGAASTRMPLAEPPQLLSDLGELLVRVVLEPDEARPRRLGDPMRSGERRAKRSSSFITAPLPSPRQGSNLRVAGGTGAQERP